MQASLTSGYACDCEDLISAAISIPLDDYLNSSYEPDAEYVDGFIEERPMGQFDHASWQLAILKWFLARQQRWNIRVLPELRIRVSATRYRVPDVTVLDRDQPIEQIITTPPLSVFEVLSPEDTLQRLKRKLDDYAFFGIPQIWVIDPDDRTFFRYLDRQLIRAAEFCLPEKEIQFQVTEIEGMLD
jgi:Uma2 family endonuclease